MKFMRFLGGFFLNDLIEAEDEENKCIVADVSIKMVLNFKAVYSL